MSSFSYAKNKPASSLDGIPVGDGQRMIVPAHTKVILNGTAWPVYPVDRTISFCPGDGSECCGSITIDGTVYSYNSSKDAKSEDVIITQ